MGAICATAGLRISEALGLKWEDIDFERGQANVLRSVVDGAVGRCKTEIFQQSVPLNQGALNELQSWQNTTLYGSDPDWVFASDRVFGAMPVWAGSSLQKVLQPAARRAGMRHAKLSTKMEVYTHARTTKKREVQGKVVDALFSRKIAEAVA